MAHHTLVSWAEPAPGQSELMTASDLARLADDAWTYELVEGRLVRMPLAGTGHGRRAAKLMIALGTYAEPRELGIVFTAETGFLLSKPGEPDTVLGPDVAFLRTEHIPSQSEQEQAFWRVAPDLVVEVASPGHYRPELADKVRRYLAAGVQLVRVVWPRYRQVDVRRAGSPAPVTLSVGDDLDGGDVVPGFTYPVARLFE